VTLRIYIRPRHMTDEGLAALRDMLAQHPGEDLVEVALYSQRVRLPVRVDASVRNICHLASAALGGACTSILIGAEPAF
jgi:hypothetical protein